MTTLDNIDSNYIDPQDVKMMPTAMRYGLIAGLFSILLGLITNVLDLVDPANPSSPMSWVVFLLNWGILIGAIVMAIKYHRDEELGGYITMGRALAIGVLTVLFLGILAMVWTYIYMSFIDPGMVDELIAAQVTQMESQGMSDEQIEQSMVMVKKFMTPIAISIIGLVMNLFAGTIISAISGGIMKKIDPMA